MLVKRQEAFSETRIDDEVVVMLLDTGEFLSIAGTGCDIWTRIDGSCGRAQLIADLASEYDAPENEIAADVDDFLAMLKDAGLIADE